MLLLIKHCTSVVFKESSNNNNRPWTCSWGKWHEDIKGWGAMKQWQEPWRFQGLSEFGYTREWARKTGLGREFNAWNWYRGLLVKTKHGQRSERLRLGRGQDHWKRDDQGTESLRLGRIIRTYIANITNLDQSQEKTQQWARIPDHWEMRRNDSEVSWKQGRWGAAECWIWWHEVWS